MNMKVKKSDVFVDFRHGSYLLCCTIDKKAFVEELRTLRAASKCFAKRSDRSARRRS